MPAAPDLDSLAEYLRAGRYQEVETLLRNALADGNKDPALLELLVEAVRRQGAGEEAMRLSEELLAGFPGRSSAWREAGRTCNNLGRLDAARRMFARAAELDPEDADIQHDLAHVCLRLGDSLAARRAFRHAADLKPGWSAPYFRLGLLEIDAGNYQQAERALDTAVRLNDSNADVWTALGVARHRQGNNAAASEAYANALARDPRHAEARGNLAISLHDDGKLADAIDSYQQALLLSPGDVRAAAHLADALLEAGECERALDTAENILKRFPGHAGALASQAAAWLRLGKVSEYNSLINLERLVVAVDIDVPAAYASLADFNRALVRHVQEHESLRFEPAGHATRHGHHTGDLLRFEKGPVAALEAAVSGAIGKYRKVLAELPDHPLARFAPPAWRLSMWSVVMGSSGHQLPHIHPTAWLSGVYYARLPPEVTETDAGQAGWIEFGPPPARLAGDTDFPAVRQPPRVGRMFVFPAFLYHQTVPFESAEPRISLAFDVAPLAGTGANMGR